MARHTLAAVLLACSLALLHWAAGQLSDPVALDRQINTNDNKFLQRQADRDLSNGVPTFNDEVALSGQCDANLALKWMTEVSSSIYATPLIHDLYSDGHKDIIVPSFVHYLEVVEGSNGAKATEDAWPAFHSSTVHTSPLTFDFDFDGVQDILLATYDGEILVFKDTGDLLPDKLVVPRLRVRKDWYKGLNPDPIDHSNPDVGAAPDAQQAATAQETLSNGSRSRRQLLQVDGSQQEEAKVQGAENKGALPDEAADSFTQLFGDPGDVKAVDPAGSQELDWDSLPLDADGLGGIGNWHDSYQREQGEIYPDVTTFNSGAWEDEGYFEAPHLREGQFVQVDAHILCTPVMADIDQDGHAELVVAASYFYDREFYDLPGNKAELGKDVDTAKYIGGGIVVFDLHTRGIKWSQHLDLSTDHTQFRAYIYSAPTLADLDQDGNLEIIVGTSMGFLYVLDSRGRTRENWPIQMGEIQAQVATSDLRNDGSLVLLAVDARGNVAAFDADAKELWERHLGTLIAQAATFGDVNDDGKLEVLLGATSGELYVLDGTTGRNVGPFPYQTQGRIMAPILPTRLRPGRSLQLVFPSYDGHLYVVDGLIGCADVVDIGETAYAMVLADDLDGDGRLDLLLATMNGNLYAFQTAAPADPLAIWPAQVLGRNGFTSRLGWLSVAATPATRQPRDVRGHTLPVRFKLDDPRPLAANVTQGPYTVFVTLQGVGAREMNAGEQPVIGMTDTYTQPGVYTLEVPCPRTRSAATVRIELQDAHGLVVADSFSLSFHMHFHRLLKWLLAAPFAAGALAVLAYQAEGVMGLGLPSFRQ